MNVSRGGYYDWLKRPESERSKQNKTLLKKIIDVHQRSRKIYGYPRIHQELIAQGETSGRHRIARIMQNAGIKSKMAKRFRRAKEAKHREGIQPNLLDRQFNAARPNQRWVSDISMIPTQSGWLHLAVVMDLYSRAIVGWSMSASMSCELIKDALQMALSWRKRTGTLLHHSDQGSQYRSAEYQRVLKENDIQSSMSGKGNCYDNAAMESFFHSLKVEWVYHEKYRNQNEAKRSIFEYIEIFYNRKRRHSTISYKAPFEFEKLCFN